ncbi:MAG: hypothetical protein U1F83_18310 [Verrucomicrobiota bacterium]|jgi:hypothetical protein
MTNPGAVMRRPIWTWLCGLSSSALLLALIALAAHIRIALGRWPQFGEECHTAFFRAHEIVLGGMVLFTVYVAAPLWLILLSCRQFRISWRVHLTQALVYGLGWLSILLTGKYDPTPFTNWLLD